MENHTLFWESYEEEIRSGTSIPACPMVLVKVTLTVNVNVGSWRRKKELDQAAL